MQVKQLAGLETQRLLAGASGLPAGRVEQLVGTPSDPGAAASLSGEEQRKLLQDVFGALSAADALPEYEAIAMPRMRVAVSQAVCECLLSVYRSVYTSLEHAGAAQDMKAPGQVATLLGVPEDAGS